MFETTCRDGSSNPRTWEEIMYTNIKGEMFGVYGASLYVALSDFEKQREVHR